MQELKKQLSNLGRSSKNAAKWITFAIITGVIMGFVGTAFVYGINFCTVTRQTHSWLIFLLPLGGLAIVGSYRLLHNEKDGGTNLVLSAIHSNENIPLRMAPLIFVSTLITHLCGGSAGREGAALQLGGSIGNSLGKLFRFNEKDNHIMIMCGMSGAFAAVFGTPLAAAIFSMEVVSVGIMHYSALVPCVISALIAHGIAVYFGAQHEIFFLNSIPNFDVRNAVLIAILAILCGVLSILFCVILHQTEGLYRKFFKNPYLRVVIGGLIVVGLTLLVRNQDFNGTGIDVIAACFAGEKIAPYSFALKMIFTALTLGAGFKGGEIVPSFYVGATFGCVFGNLIGLSPELCAAVGMGAVFCGVTNSPITSLFICFELFGFDGMPYYLIAIALSYLTSGYYGLYSSQKIIYSKYKTEYINRKTH